MGTNDELRVKTMTPMAAHRDDLDGAVDAAIAACDGDPRAAVPALLVANNFLTEQVDALATE